MVKILNSTYVKTYLQQVAANADQLVAKDRTQLLSLLQDFEDFSDGTLGDWDTEPFNLDFNTDSKPFNCKYYPFPKIKKETFQKELQRLLKIGVLTWVQQSKYGPSVFIIPNKEGTVIFIMDYHRLNQKLVIKTYTLPRIGKTMQKLEGLQHANILDLNMGDYTIKLLPASQDTMTIDTEFGKIKYNFLPMGICALGYIFQAKVDNLLGENEGVKTYIDALLVLSKEKLSKHINQLRIIFGRLHAAVLK